jgi:hypothetical protein
VNSEQPGLGIPLIVLLGLSQSACVVVGYSSRGGWSVWPGGAGLIIMFAIAAVALLWVVRR